MSQSHDSALWSMQTSQQITGEGRTRRPVLRRAILAFVAVIALSFWGGTAIQAAGATTVTEVGCGILLPGILPEGQVVSVTGMLVVTAGGTATLTCRGELDPTLAPSHTVIITDIDCALGEGGQVGESHTHVSPNGSVLMVCQNNPGSEPFVPGEGD